VIRAGAARPAVAFPVATGAAPAAADGEAELVERVRHGDGRAFDTLVTRYMHRAFSVAFRVLGQKEDAEDLVQDTFMVVLQRIDSFEPGRAFAPWFFRILVNRGLNARKARALRTVDEIPDTASSPGPVAGARGGARGAPRASRRRPGHPPQRQRLVVELFELEGFSGPEIAQIMEISDGTVRWHLHEARKALRQALAPYERSREE
jgi:RNA polymerase sigma-70 factor (ECF subfamily)